MSRARAGTFEVSITVPEKYPFVPLQMKFITKVKMVAALVRRSVGRFGADIANPSGISP